jgi:CheY-like chemotaxis protein
VKAAALNSTHKYPEENVAMDTPTLLYIDDLPQALELRKATLESQGYSVKLASNGYDAIKTLEESSVAAVLLEYKQEGMDAEAVACHIKQRFGACRTSVGWTYADEFAATSKASTPTSSSLQATVIKNKSWKGLPLEPTTT